MDKKDGRRRFMVMLLICTVIMAAFPPESTSAFGIGNPFKKVIKIIDDARKKLEEYRAKLGREYKKMRDDFAHGWKKNRDDVAHFWTEFWEDFWEPPGITETGGNLPPTRNGIFPINKKGQAEVQFDDAVKIAQIIILVEKWEEPTEPVIRLKQPGGKFVTFKKIDCINEPFDNITSRIILYESWGVDDNRIDPSIINGTWSIILPGDYRKASLFVSVIAKKRADVKSVVSTEQLKGPEKKPAFAFPSWRVGPGLKINPQECGTARIVCMKLFVVDHKREADALLKVKQPKSTQIDIKINDYLHGETTGQTTCYLLFSENWKKKKPRPAIDPSDMEGEWVIEIPGSYSDADVAWALRYWSNGEELASMIKYETMRDLDRTVTIADKSERWKKQAKILEDGLRRTSYLLIEYQQEPWAVGIINKGLSPTEEEYINHIFFLENHIQYVKDNLKKYYITKEEIDDWRAKSIEEKTIRRRRRF